MPDVGEPTPMKREQDPPTVADAADGLYMDLMEKIATAYPETRVQSTLRSRISFLLSELARLRTEAHQMQEENAALREGGHQRPEWYDYLVAKRKDP